jgi:hypothetical protein
MKILIEIAGCLLMGLGLLHAAFPRYFRWREETQALDPPSNVSRALSGRPNLCGPRTHRIPQPSPPHTVHAADGASTRWLPVLTEAPWATQAPREPIGLPQNPQSRWATPL